MTVAVVLAAGVGRRLASVSLVPKWLTDVDGACPADNQLGALDAAGIGRVVVVAGDDPTEIRAHVGPWEERLDIEVIENDHSSTRNNWYSLLLGLEHLAVRGHDVVVLNSDLFAATGWLHGAIADVTSSSHPAALAIDPSRGDLAEQMSVRLDVAGATVTDIGKEGIDQPGGEYVGLSWWSSGSAAELASVLHSFVDVAERVDHWYEHAVREHLLTGASYAAISVPSADWVEIDDERDLEAARRLPS